MNYGLTEDACLAMTNGPACDWITGTEPVDETRPTKPEV